MANRIADAIAIANNGSLRTENVDAGLSWLAAASTRTGDRTLAAGGAASFRDAAECRLAKRELMVDPPCSFGPPHIGASGQNA
jgi:hypothetical protein